MYRDIRVHLVYIQRLTLKHSETGCITQSDVFTLVIYSHINNTFVWMNYDCVGTDLGDILCSFTTGLKYA